MVGIEIAKKSDLDNKADENHTHIISDISNLQITIESLQTSVNEKAPLNHNHDGKYQPVGNYADKNHTHSYKDLTDKPTIPSVDGLAKQADLDVLADKVSALEAKIEALQPPEE